MRLDFQLPWDRFDDGMHDAQTAVRGCAARTSGGIATVLRMDNGQPLAPGEFRIELSPRSRGWVLVTDAWYFREGEGARWQAARYGEFRVRDDGRALSRGLARRPAATFVRPSLDRHREKWT